MDVISRLARKYGWVTKAEVDSYLQRSAADLAHVTGENFNLREEISNLKKELSHSEELRAQTQGRLVGEVQRNDDLSARLTEAEGELREIRKGLMIRVGLLPNPARVSPEEPPKPIQSRRKPWDQARTEIEKQSKDKFDHWTAKIKEVEDRDKAKQAPTPTETTDEIERDVQELADEPSGVQN